MRLLGDLARELPRAARTLRRAPTASLLALLTLALGIGANAAIFSVVEAALLRPLPFREPERLAAVTLRMPVQYGPRVIDMVWSYPKARAFRDAQTAFDALSLHKPEPVTVAAAGGGAEGAERLPAELVEPPYLALLGVGAERGRVFEPGDEGTLTAVIGHALAVRRFGSADAALGRQLDVEGRPFTVVGVLPPRFRGLSGDADLWLLVTSVRAPRALASAGAHQYHLVARRARGVSPERARAEVARAGAAIDRTFPGDDGRWGAAAYALDEVRVDPALRRSVVVLSAAVALVLLIACVNVANLTLARGAARRRELAVRHALGADRRRLVGQLVAEGLVLTGAGTAVGLAVAVLLARLLRAAAPVAASAAPGESVSLARVALGAIGLDARVVLFTAAVALVTGLLVSLAPALVTTRSAMVRSLRQGASAVPAFAGLRRMTGRGALVAAEVALAVMLLVGAGLTIRSLGRLLDAQVGYDPRGVLTARVSLSPVRYAADSAPRFWDEVLGRARALPGVESAALASCAPVGDDCEGTSITVAGRAEAPHVALVYVSPDYFRAMRTPLLRGRPFTAADRRGAPPVMIVNETAARTIWGADDPLRTPTTGDGARQVVGVVADYRIDDPEAPVRPAIFVPFLQNPRSRGMLFLRTPLPPASLGAALRREVAAADRLHAVHDVRSMGERIADATARGRFSARVLGAFAAAALLLAAVGIYGVLALAVTQRTREFGVRLALGAHHRRVVAMVLREAMALVAVGAAAGLLGALAAGRALRSLLYDLAPADPWTYAGTVAVLALAAATAALVPAVRAARASPLEAMRSTE